MTPLTCPKCHQGMTEAALDVGWCPSCGLAIPDALVVHVPKKRRTSVLVLAAALMLLALLITGSIYRATSEAPTNEVVVQNPLPHEPPAAPVVAVAPAPREAKPRDNTLTNPPGSTGVNGNPVVLRKLEKSRSTGMILSPVRAREFNMGSPAHEPPRRSEELLHPVLLTRPFQIGVFEVTQEEYRIVMKASPSWFAQEGEGNKKVAGMNTDRFPVEQVTWFNAIDFCNRLSVLDGYEPYYTLANEKRENGFLMNATVTIAGGNGYRLPTEAEWECACRADTDTAFSFGPRVVTAREGNFKSLIPGGGYGGPETVFLGRTAMVGSYPQNPSGHHDFHGNVAEWCFDWYDKDYYSISPKENPPGPATGMHRVVRGGSWLVDNSSCRSAARGSQLPTDGSYTTGFRVARFP